MLSPSEGREGRDNTSFPCRGNSQCVNMCELKVPGDGDGGMQQLQQQLLDLVNSKAQNVNHSELSTGVFFECVLE